LLSKVVLWGTLLRSSDGRDKEKHAEVIWRKALGGDGSYPRRVKSIVEDMALEQQVEYN
jgi:hypothetical protein